MFIKTFIFTGIFTSGNLQTRHPTPVLCIYAVSRHLLPPKSNHIQIGCRASLYAAVGRGDVGSHAGVRGGSNITESLLVFF